MKRSQKLPRRLCEREGRRLSKYATGEKVPFAYGSNRVDVASAPPGDGKKRGTSREVLRPFTRLR